MTSPAPSTSPTNAPLAAPPINRIWNSPCPPPKNAACPMSAGRSSTPLNLFMRSEEHTSELQSQSNLVCRLLLEKQDPTRRQRAAAGLIVLTRGQCDLPKRRRRTTRQFASPAHPRPLQDLARPRAHQSPARSHAS